MSSPILSVGKQGLLGACLFSSSVSLSLADEHFVLSSPDFRDQGMLPLNCKCQRDGGSGLSPALDWTSAPEDTQGFWLMMHHYPGAPIGQDDPSHYWSLWNVPADVHSLSLGNTKSTGNVGADKDHRGVGYTPPCSHGGATHSYTMTLYALNTAPDTLGTEDDPAVDWSTVMRAIEGKVIASSALTFRN